MGGEAIGYTACIVAGVGFGSNFVPVKKFKVGDGVFFQWVMCCAIWCVGLITVAFEKEDHTFYPIAMLGGFLWCTGNIMCVQVINMIGMSMGLMVWGITNSVAGWALGKFGLFGVEKEHVNHASLNYAGLAFTVLALALFSNVQPNIKNDDEEDLTEKMLPNHAEDRTTLGGRSKNATRLIGFVLACVCGIFFGFSFAPARWKQTHGGSDRFIDYAFSHFSGIFMTSTAFMLIYSAHRRNQPIVDSQLVLPAFASGTLWAIAQVSWFIAIESLGKLTVANPIVTSLPSIVAGLWGILLFREIEGMKNLSLFCGGLLLAIIGVILIALSN